MSEFFFLKVFLLPFHSVVTFSFVGLINNLQLIFFAGHLC